MNRREFGKAVAALSCGPLLQRKGMADEVLLYFVDGYHGGVRGHMPPGAWRDIVTRLHLTPEWKLCLDIEPASWRALAERDPDSYVRLTEFLRPASGVPRVEMVGGTFAQPYGWAVSGESNIRQLVRGLEVIHESFPGLAVDTYAMQEPCWASCLPQILVSLGFKAAVLKDPSTAWGGYSVGIDAETVHWIGPDGSSIRTVPRYACEELLDTWRTEAQTGSEAFAEKCYRNGIKHPAGMCFQDLGWAARPNVQGSYIRFVTWREYMRSVASETVRDWRFSMEDIRCALPWGEKTLQRIASEVRSAENRLIVAEKMASLAAIATRGEYPAEALQRAWEKTLWSQHHDVWITATTRSGLDAWAFQAAAQTWDTDGTCAEVIDASFDRLAGPPRLNANASGARGTIYVCNTLAQERAGFVEVNLPTDIGTKSVRVVDSGGRAVASQFEITRKYLPEGADRVRGNRSSELKAEESIGAGRLLFNAATPATGYAVYKFETNAEPSAAPAPGGATAQTAPNGTVTLESDLYRIQIDPAKGGIISGLYAKELQKEFCLAGERSFGEFRGYFIEEKSWRSSTESAASIEIVERGPVRTTAAVTGKIAEVPFRTEISITQGQRRIDFHTQFRFAKDTWIGDPWENPAAERMTGRRRSEYDDRYKLLALFPVRFQNGAIYKNSAYDVCRSKNTDTFFDSWDAIKHNIILNWVDLFDDASHTGLALMSDHTTSYAHGPEHPLSLVMGWGWDGGFWWGKCPLMGLQEAKYAVVPHAGLWDKAALWRETAQWAEPLLARLGPEQADVPAWSILEAGDPGIQLSALTVKGRDLMVRLFNAESEAEQHEIRFKLRPHPVELIELDGRSAGSLKVFDESASSFKVRLQIPRFGLKTLRLRDAIA